MSTEAIENNVLPMTESVEVGISEEEMDRDIANAEAELMGDPDDHDLARAADEGMHDAKPLPVPEEFTVAERLALGHLYDVQDRLDKAKEDHEAKADVAKTAKKRVETLQDDLSMAVRKLREAKTAGEPDPKRFPLFDKAKADINAQFGKPMTIPPAAPDTFAEALRRRQRDTPLASMGLKPSTLRALEELGLTTALQLVDLLQDTLDRGRKATSIKGMTEHRYAEVVESLGEITDAAESEWAILHPGEDAEDVAESERILAAQGDATVPFEVAMAERGGDE